MGRAERPVVIRVAALPAAATRTAACTVDIRAVGVDIRAVPARMAACPAAHTRREAVDLAAVAAADRLTANSSKDTKHQWEPKRVPTLVLSANDF